MTRGLICWADGAGPSVSEGSGACAEPTDAAGAVVEAAGASGGGEAVAAAAELLPDAVGASSSTAHPFPFPESAIVDM